jgi:hypothetical protein
MTRRTDVRGLIRFHAIPVANPWTDTIGLAQVFCMCAALALGLVIIPSVCSADTKWHGMTGPGAWPASIVAAKHKSPAC